MSPLTRPWAWPTGSSTKCRGCFDESVKMSMTSVGASYCGPRCSRGGQPPRGRGRKPGSSTSTRGRSYLKGSGLPSASSTSHHRG
jgi:hypothetical protein